TALGARASDVLRLVLLQALRRTAVGLALGVVVALLLTRLLSGWLYGVSPTDPWTFVGVSLLLAGAAAVACYLPARKAANVSPLLALRGEQRNSGGEHSARALPARQKNSAPLNGTTPRSSMCPD